METINKQSTRSINSLIAMMILLALAAFTQIAQAQTAYKVTAGSQIKVSGTSNMHDWNMLSSNFTCQGNFVMKDGDLQDVNTLVFSLPVCNLKSKDKLMDTRAYKALNEEKHKSISFKLTNATVIPQQKIIKATGDLTISGVTKPVTIQTAYTINADQSITYKGSKLIKMSSHDVKAPSFMMGALKTGDDVTIDILLKLKK